MKLMWAEWRKLLSSKILLGLLVVLIVSNFALVLYTSKCPDIERVEREVYTDYLEDPTPYDEYYAELKDILYAAFRDEPNLPYTYSGDENYNDYMVLSRIYERDAYFDGFEANIKKIIKQTENRIEDLHNYGYSDKTYTTGSQIALKQQYEDLLDEVTLTKEYTRGYDTYLNYQLVTVFILLFITAAVSYVFLNDNTVGFRDIMYTTARGRLPSVVAKISVSLFVCVITTLIFLGTTFLAVGIAEGYSSPFSPVQNFSDFMTVPDSVSIIEYILLQTGLRFCAFAVFTLLIALLASLCLSYAVCFGGGIIFVAVNCFIFYRPYSGTIPMIRYLNFAAMTEGCALTSFFRTVSLFKAPVRTTTAMVVFSSLLCFALVVVTAFCFCKCSLKFNGFVSKISAAVNLLVKRTQGERKGKQKSSAPRSYPLRLWIYELGKKRVFIVFLLMLILLCGRIMYVNAAVGNMESYSEALYYGYIDDIKALSLSERERYIVEERARIDRLINDYDQMSEAHRKGDITSAEYSAYLDDYYRAFSQSPIFGKVEDYVEYINEKNIETELDGKIIYSVGYERLFALSSDVFLFAALIVLSFNVFSVEYSDTGSSGGFVHILRTTKKGRNAAFRSKLYLHLILSGAFAIIFKLIDVIVVMQSFPLTDMDTTLYSVQSFEVISSPITIRQYLAISILMQIVSAVVISTMIVMLSFFMKKIFAILTSTLLSIGIPELIVSTILPALFEISILSLTSPKRIMCRSADLKVFSNEAVYWSIICILWLVAAVILTMFARTKYSGKRYKGEKENVADN